MCTYIPPSVDSLPSPHPTPLVNFTSALYLLHFSLKDLRSYFCKGTSLEINSLGFCLSWEYLRLSFIFEGQFCLIELFVDSLCFLVLCICHPTVFQHSWFKTMKHYQSVIEAPLYVMSQFSFALFKILCLWVF